MKTELESFVPSAKHLKVFSEIIKNGYYNPPNAQSPFIKKLERIGMLEFRDDFRGMHFTELGKEIYLQCYATLDERISNVREKVCLQNASEKYRIRKAASQSHKVRRKNQADQRGPDMPTEINGHRVVFYYKTNYEKQGLTNKTIINHDIMDEYAVVEAVDADCGVMVYYRINRDDAWLVNPWSTRFLIRILLENIGISFLPIK